MTWRHTPTIANTTYHLMGQGRLHIRNQWLKDVTKARTTNRRCQPLTHEPTGILLCRSNMPRLLVNKTHVDSAELRDDAGRCAISTPHDCGYENNNSKTFKVTCHDWTSPTQTRLGHLVLYSLNRQKLIHKVSLLPSSNRTMRENGHTLQDSLFRGHEIFWWSQLVVCAVGCLTLQDCDQS